MPWLGDCFFSPERPGPAQHFPFFDAPWHPGHTRTGTMSRARLARSFLSSLIALALLSVLPWRQVSAQPEKQPPRIPGIPSERQDKSLDPYAITARCSQVHPGPIHYDPETGRYIGTCGTDRAVLSLNPRIQQTLEKLLADYRVPVGSTVLLEPRTGRVVAMAEHVEKGPASHIALQPIAPAASIFKIVTSAALLERGISPDTEICYHGGKHRISKSQLSDNPRRDHRCLTLSSALGRSANVVFAKLAERDLSSERLRVEAGRFLFNAPLPFDWPVQPSVATIPDDPFERATTAAGFGPVRLSPLHGAVIAALVANGGRFVPPRIVDSIGGVPVPTGIPQRVLQPQIAATLTRMMQTTVTEGTGRKVFRQSRASRSSLRDVSIAGKTGSLSDKSPFRDYSWFVGFAPAEDPQVAVATVIVNDRVWRVKAPYVAREALRAYFEGAGINGARTASR